MTDARFPERWLNDRRVMRLSDPAFRLFVVTLVWAVSNRTDGLIEDDDLLLLTSVDGFAAEECAQRGLWRRDGDGWRIVDFETTQTTSTQLDGLEHLRAMDRDRKARERAHKRDDHRLCLPEHCPHVTPDVTPDRTRDT